MFTLIFTYTLNFSLLLHNKWLVLKLNAFKLNSRIHQFKFEREMMNMFFCFSIKKFSDLAILLLH